MQSTNTTREEILEKIVTVFNNVAVEGHLQGSMARGNTDYYSDIDIWMTFKDEDFSLIKEKRLEYYSEVGEVLHICEAPQNRPTNGIYSSVIYKTKTGLFVVDYVLCPLSTSYRTEDFKSVFGDLKLPEGQFKYNTEKVGLPETYRLDFVISIINGAIKKLLRKDDGALEFLIEQYQYLKDRYDIPIETLTTTENTFENLYNIINKVKKVATDKQKKTLTEIETSARCLSSTMNG